MTKRTLSSAWARTFQRSMAALTRSTVQASQRTARAALKKSVANLATKSPPRGAGEWISGMVIGAAGVRRYRLYRPAGARSGQRSPLMVMLHGCGQDANSFATSTRMNTLAERAGFWVLYPEQDRLSNLRGCWNWFDTDSGRAYGEVALIMAAIDQVLTLYPVDRTRVAVAGLSAGASMAALAATRHPQRFQAVVMHSGIAPGVAHSGLSALGVMQGSRKSALSAVSLATLTTRAQPWPPLLVIHGAQDSVVDITHAQAAVQLWTGGIDVATASPTRSSQRGKRHPAVVTHYKQGKGRQAPTVATLVEVSRMGHAWSGGLATQPYGDAQGPDASRMAWAFAAKQFGLK